MPSPSPLTVLHVAPLTPELGTPLRNFPAHNRYDVALRAATHAVTGNQYHKVVIAWPHDSGAFGYEPGPEPRPGDGFTITLANGAQYAFSWGPNLGQVNGSDIIQEQIETLGILIQRHPILSQVLSVSVSPYPATPGGITTTITLIARQAGPAAAFTVTQSWTIPGPSNGTQITVTPAVATSDMGNYPNMQAWLNVLVDTSVQQSDAGANISPYPGPWPAAIPGILADALQTPLGPAGETIYDLAAVARHWLEVVPPTGLNGTWHNTHLVRVMALYGKQYDATIDRDGSLYGPGNDSPLYMWLGRFDNRLTTQEAYNSLVLPIDAWRNSPGSTGINDNLSPLSYPRDVITPQHARTAMLDSVKYLTFLYFPRNDGITYPFIQARGTATCADGNVIVIRGPIVPVSTTQTGVWSLNISPRTFPELTAYLADVGEVLYYDVTAYSVSGADGDSPTPSRKQVCRGQRIAMDCGCDVDLGDVLWLNSYGGWDSWPVYGRSEKAVTSDIETNERSIARTGPRGTRVSTEVNEATREVQYTLHLGMVSAWQAELLNDINSSTHVYMRKTNDLDIVGPIAGTWLFGYEWPFARVVQQQLTLRQTSTDSLFEAQITVELSY